MMAGGKALLEACKHAWISNESYYRVSQDIWDIKVNQSKKLQEIETENARLKKTGSRAIFAWGHPANAMIVHGILEHIRSDNDPGLAANRPRD